MFHSSSIIIVSILFYGVYLFQLALILSVSFHVLYINSTVVIIATVVYGPLRNMILMNFNAVSELLDLPA